MSFSKSLLDVLDKKQQWETIKKENDHWHWSTLEKRKQEAKDKLDSACDKLDAIMRGLAN